METKQIIMFLVAVMCLMLPAALAEENMTNTTIANITNITNETVSNATNETVTNITNEISSNVTNETNMTNATQAVKINDFWANVTDGVAPLHTNFSANVTGNVTSYLWILKPVSSNYYSKHYGSALCTYTEPGVYNVTLTVSGPEGNDTMTKLAYINVTKKVITQTCKKSTTTCSKSTITKKVCPEYTKSKNTILVFSAEDIQKKGATYTWTFGDGCKTATKEIKITHTYKKCGNYKVTCVAKVCSSSKTGSAEVKVI